MERLGQKLRQQRHKLGMTLDELAVSAAISKPYLSLIETGRVPNPPSDDKLRRLEQSLGFNAGELISHAHLHRTPVAVRAILNQLLKNAGEPQVNDDEQLSLLIQQLATKTDVPIAAVLDSAIPIINGESTGYPRNFADLNFPATVATEFVTCPGLTDKDAFAVRVAGDRMTPSYFENDIVIFSPAATAKNGDDCFVRFADGKTAFARIFIESKEIRLQPRNEKYRPQVVAAGKVAASYPAVARQHRLEDAS